MEALIASEIAPEPRQLSVVYNRADRIFRRIVTSGALTSLVL
ncbi:MAG: hypothetical protein RL353_44, partial [Actinomycetota bacterium]